MVLTAREAVLTTPRVALANDNTRLACMSPSNRLVRKRCTSVKQRVWLGCIAWLRESYCVPRKLTDCGCEATEAWRATQCEVKQTSPDSFQNVPRPCRILLPPGRLSSEMRGWMREA